ncbi:MAG: uroporphyrinogen-III C-methyltransferase [Candidatus Dadabacteria bacterium]|nr:MAG: uroporphyrinogen-III C-methyltransferase [Candidatus Dadabacteria bacterium]
MNNQPGKVYLIGAGPGADDLITLRGKRALQESDVVLYDRLSSRGLLKYCKPSCEFINVGKEDGRHPVPQEEINRLIITNAAAGKVVSRLKGGDALVFARGGEEFETVIREGLDCEIVPGVTAAFGAAASLAIPLTHRDYASGVLFLTGHKKKDGDYSEYRNLDLARFTHVIYMGILNINALVSEIVSSNPEHGGVPAAVIERASTEAERVVTAELSKLPAVVERDGIKPPALIIIGRVVEFYDRLKGIRKRSSAGSSGAGSSELIIVAHGSRRVQSNQEVENLTVEIAGEIGSTYAHVSCAFLEMASPSIPEAIDRAAGRRAERIVILPHFLAAGTHVTKDIPAIIEEKKKQYPDIHFEIRPHSGQSPLLKRAIIELSE